MRRNLWSGTLVAVALASVVQFSNYARSREMPLPVGYDQPGSDTGGPALAQGLSWVETVWPRYLPLVHEKFAGGKPTVMFITNGAVQDKLHALDLRFPIDAVALADYTFAGREAFERALASRPRFDCFVLSRVDARRIPADVQYEILRRVKEDGTGLLVIDMHDRSVTLDPGFLGLKPTEQGNQVASGIPYDGLRQWTLTETTDYLSYNFWHRNLQSQPEEKPFVYGRTRVAPFGAGTVVWSDTGSDWERRNWARTLLPHIDLRRDMWVENDYHYSHAVKLMLRAMGHAPVAKFASLTIAAGSPTAVVTCADPFSGVMRWQIRDTWGEISDRGEFPVQFAAGENPLPLPKITFPDAGRRFLDLWLENSAAETVDWASGFTMIERGVAPPEIVPAHPDGAPRGADLTGTVKLADVPAGARLRMSLVDRHWREVGLTEVPAAEAALPYRFPAAGLDGQIWTVKADLLDADGRILAQSHLSVTSPHLRGTRDGFHPLVTLMNHAGPEAAAQREFLRRIGFLSSRPYSPGNTMMAETAAWNDIQMHPFFRGMTQSHSDWRQDRIVDWEEPHVEREIREGAAFMTAQLKRFGHRGFNLTDDSAPAKELPVGAYTAIRFHEWLEAEYGGLDETLRAWGWRAEFAAPPPAAGELPADPYVLEEFHRWLEKKYGGIPQTAAAWKLKSPPTFGSLRGFGIVEPGMVRQLQDAGNALPAEDAKAFLAERAATANPWGAINRVSVKRGYDAGVTAPWIDAQRFLIGRWIASLVWVKEAATAVNPDIAVGSDSSYYGEALDGVFGELDYVAPYHTDFAVKVAVSRGRMRRAGDFGACVGSYGEKPARMYGRRSQIWNILFAGGTGFYYWMMVPHPGMNDDLTMSDKHGLYQAEVTEEIMSGIGELFTAAERQYAPVAILSSMTSGLCDELEKAVEPVTAKNNSIRAFQVALQDLIVNPHFITAEELIGGWLQEHGTRLLVLPGVNSLSDAEAASIRTFVEGGGTVVADIRPGARLPNGTPREQPALDEVFGVTTDPEATGRRVRGQLTGRALSPDATLMDFGLALADPRIKPLTAKPFGSLDGTPALLVNLFGRGRAVLFNASFASQATYRTEGGEVWRPWHEVMKAVTEFAGITREFRGTSEDRETPGFEFSPFRLGAGWLVGVADLGCGDFIGERRPFSLALPGRFHAYEVRSGRPLGEGELLSDEMPRNGHRAYALLPYAVTDVALTAGRDKLILGETAVLELDVNVKGGSRGLHVVRLEAMDPDGNSFFPFRRVLKLPPGAPLRVPLTFARNDLPGRWTILATDINSGRRASLGIDVSREAAK